MIVSRYPRADKLRCVPCVRYFVKYRCSAATHSECDCPRCQGLCTCRAIVTRDPKPRRKEK